MIQQFDQSNYRSICDQLAAADPELQYIIDTHGYPPFWSRLMPLLVLSPTKPHATFVDPNQPLRYMLVTTPTWANAHN
jgi:hypothetical protein